MTRTVWITGLGAVTAFGPGVPALLQALLRGEAGLSPVEGIPTTRGKLLGGQVKHPDFAGPHRLSDMAAATVAEAVAQAGWSAAELADAGLFVGTTGSECQLAEDRHAELAAADQADPALRDALLRFTNGALADLLAQRFAITGPRDVNTNACASGTIAFARALTALRLGRIRRAVVCGADQLRPLTYWGTERAGLLGHDLRPFHKDRGGTVFGDGAGAMVLEWDDDARARDARPLAALAGWGVVCDENPQLIVPQLDGGAAVRCFHAALRDAGLAADEIDYINAHGTGTLNIDRIEVVAIKQVFGERATQIPVNSTKSLTGHLSAASPLIEGIATVLAIANGYIHPTAKLDQPDPSFGLDFVPLRGRYQTVRGALSNSMGGGGTNAMLAFTSPDREAPARPAPAPLSDVVITGAGAVSLLGAGRQAIGASLLDGAQRGAGRLGNFDIRSYVDPALQYEHLSRAAQLSLAAAVLAGGDARLGADAAHPDRVAVIFGTAFGGTPAWSEMLCKAYATDPRHITPNMALEHGHHLGVTLIARREGARGSNVTLTGGRTSGLEAIGFAADLLRTGACDVAIVGAGDSLDDILARSLQLLGCSAPPDAEVTPYGAAHGYHPADGAACLVLERRAGATARGARILGSLAGFGSAGAPVGLAAIDATGEALVRATRAALAEAGVRGQPVAACGSGNGTPGLDAGELRALDEVARRDELQLQLVSLHGRFGETFAAGPLLSLIGGLDCLTARRVPRWIAGAPPAGSAWFARPGERWLGDALLVTGSAPGGAAAALVVRPEAP
ncbi:MAG TPA: beta-ketoacyl synthase N-terminal-like domain-containing protein [Kofleriaceae bacterium]|nr:beta-ketoacyl synthase N-terminal-like domain-containing protein [Kofleriaceae bacterium]